MSVEPSPVDLFWESDTIIDDGIAFLGSDKKDKMGLPFPGNILLPMLRKWAALNEGKYPRCLGEYLKSSQKQGWSQNINTKWLKEEILLNLLPILIFHPRITKFNKTHKLTPTYNECSEIIESEKYDCYFYKPHEVDGGVCFFEKIEQEEYFLDTVICGTKDNEYLSPILFYPKRQDIDSDLEKKMAKVAEEYMKLMQAWK